MTILIFTPDIGGHHLEYIHHIYLIAEKSNKNTYIFLLPEKFNDVKKNFLWPEKDHIKFDLFRESQFSVGLNSTMAVLKNAFRITKFVARKARDYSADVVYSNYLVLFVPFAPLLFKKTTKIVGIIYKIYLHDENAQGTLSSIIERYKFKLMSQCSVFKRVYLLNDEQSCVNLNKLFKTDKFQPIPDPFVPLEPNSRNIREEFNIPNQNTLFVHFGAMNINKGTIDILESLKQLSQTECENYTFFFAGCVSSEIKEGFYEKVDDLKRRMRIIVIDDFCTYDFFASLCTACDCIVTPYKRTSQSSGLIGYASQFGKPVIGPNKGLYGYLVKKYGLGILIDDITPESLRNAYSKISIGDYTSPNESYCKENNILAFQKVLEADIV